MAEQPRGTVTLLFTDIEGSTRLLERLGPERYRASLELHRRILRDAFQRHRGYEVDYEGDAFFVAFASADDAVGAAAAVQRALGKAAWPCDGELRVRMGVHTGEPLPAPPKYVGLDVHKAARVMAAGHGGQVLLSAATQRLIGGVEVLPLGEHRLKDLLQPEPLYQLLIEGLPSEFPALKTLGNRPTNLPVQPYPLIGREQEIGEVTALLRDPAVRLVTLAGPGGTGKTRLALQVAAEALDQFVSGVFFVSLAPIRDPGLVIPSLAQALGVREVRGERLAETVASYLEQKQMLLVLDNFEQVIEAAGEVATLLQSCAGVRLVVTSRERLRLRGEHVYPVPPLGLVDPGASVAALLSNDAVALFAARAEAATGGFSLDDENAPVVAAICGRLDGLPLAIELAAARTVALTPQALLRRLDQRLAVLTGGDRDADARQRTLRATIAWSYDLLSEPERLLFARLAVFVDGCRLEAAVAVCDGDLGVDIVDGLTLLIEKNLLRQRSDPDGEPRYWMLETIRDYASEQLHSLGQYGELADRHAGYVIEFAQRSSLELEGDRQTERGRLIEAELPNIRAVLARAEEEGDGEAVLRLVTAITTFLDIRGRGGEARAWLERGLEIAGEDVEVELRTRALAWAGDLARMQGDHAQARRHVEAAVRLAEQCGNERLLRQALHDLGEVCAYEGSYEQARQAYERVIAISTRAGEVSAGTLTNLGHLAVLEREWERARELTLQGLAVFRERKRLDGEAVCLSNLGQIAIGQGQLAESVEHFEQALDLALKLGFREIIATCLVNLGGLVARHGQAIDAARLLAAAETTLQDAELEIDPSDQECYARSLNRLDERLDPAARSTAQADGATLTPPEAAALALSAARAAIASAATNTPEPHIKQTS